MKRMTESEMLPSGGVQNEATDKAMPDNSMIKAESVELFEVIFFSFFLRVGERLASQLINLPTLGVSYLLLQRESKILKL